MVAFLVPVLSLKVEPPLTFTFVASATSTGGTITVPATAAEGDFCMLMQVARNFSNTIPAAVTPAGYTTDREAAGMTSGGENPIRVMLSRRVLGSGEAGASITGMNGGGNGKVVLVFRPSRPIVGVSLVGGGAESTSTSVNPSTQTISVSGQAPPTLLFAQASNPGEAPTLGGSLASDGTSLNGGDASQRCAYLIQNTTPADKTASCSGSASVRTLVSAGYAFT